VSLSRRLGRALPVSALALAISAASGLAFTPAVPVWDEGPGVSIVLTDVATRGDDLSVALTLTGGSSHAVEFSRSNDGGATWAGTYFPPLADHAYREPQTTVCAGHAVLVYRSDVDHPATRWTVESQLADLATSDISSFVWMSEGVYRSPDVACVANQRLVSAMFRKLHGTWGVHVMTSSLEGFGSYQAFSLGGATPGRGLSIATSSSRVYVTWFEGDTLKLRRFSIGSSASHHLTNLGTTTIATLHDGMYPQIGADGDRVFVAYMDRASLKVRRSTNQGASFGSARTLRREAFPGEIGAYPLTVAVHGSRVAIGAVEISDGGGKGLGYLSTDGGTSYTKVSQHSSGRVAASLVKVGSSYKYAEAWDESISQPDTQEVLFRRQ
jgi:hypothetical protein